jgi:thiol-disulfide isomerase/thioredoxin
MKSLLLAGLASAALLAPVRAADEPTLAIGDAAPALHVADWVKGDEVSRFEPGSVYLVEFWATWCGPCIASMPHLSELQKTYQRDGLTIIGMTSEDPNNSLEDVRKMVTAKGDGMGYTVAWDVERQTNAAYMKAAGLNGIPASFLVDQTGNIAWIGHPAELDIPLAHVVAKTWDYEKGPAMMKAIREARTAVYRAADAQPETAYDLLAAFRRDYPLAAEGLESLHFSIASRIPAKEDEATELGKQIVHEAIASEDAMGLNMFAWNLVDPEAERANRFLDLALVAAEQASELAGGEDGAILDTYARVYFWRGDLEKALELQRLAVEHTEGRMQESLKEVVLEYEKALESRRSI